MKTLKMIFITIMLMVIMMLWGQPEPQIINATEFDFANEANQMVVTDEYVYVRTTLSTSGVSQQIVQIGLVNKQVNWTRNILTSNFSVVIPGHGLIILPNSNICYPDGANIISLSEQGDTLWSQDLAPYTTGLVGFSITSAEPYLMAYSMTNDLVLLDYNNGQVINYWSIPIGGLSSCYSHNILSAVEDSVFYCSDTMPIGTQYNTGIMLSKIKINENIPEIIWQYQVDDLSNSKAMANGNTIYFQGRQVDPWCNSLVYVVIDDGESYHLNSTIDAGGPSIVTTVNGMGIWNNKLLVAAQTRIGDDPNGTGGRFANTIVYNIDGDVEWQINQYTTQFCVSNAVDIVENTIYVLGAARPSYENWQEQTIWLTEINATVGIDNSTILDNNSNLTCYPNPFKGSTTIKFSQIDNGSTTIAIYNIKGQLVKTLIDCQNLTPGEQSIVWDGKNGDGQIATPGIYFYKMDSGRFTSTGKMILMK